MNDHEHHSHSHQARKRFGQNFLVDNAIIDRIITTIRPSSTDNLVEIGPGQGALTAPLLAATGRLKAVELDRDLVALLEGKFASQHSLSLYQGDALAFDFSTLVADGPLRIVGNLPYNISTPLIFHLLDYIHQIKDMHFMLQKEVVERMAAPPGSKTYGRLSVIVQYYCQVFDLFTVPPSSFFPAPKVESAIVRLVPRLNHSITAVDMTLFRTLVRVAFQQRRKTLRNALKQLPGTWNADSVSIDLSRRPETLSVDEFANLSNELESQNV